MSARLHVLLGSGGVGKTTLAASYALALADKGRRVGLLGIDPSRRLQDALGVELADIAVGVPNAGALSAALVQPHQALRRWVREAAPDDRSLARLERNPFFSAFGDRLATATDVLAAARLAEWGEERGALDDLVVDTAPGLSAIDFLRSPRQVEAVVQGRMIRWLRTLARTSEGPLESVWSTGRRLLTGLARLGGAALLGDLGDFLAYIRAPMERMLVRLQATRTWLTAAETELLLVTSARDTAAAGAIELDDALRGEGLTPTAWIVNRVLPAELAAELAKLPVPIGATPLVHHARAVFSAQVEILALASKRSVRVVTAPSAPEVLQARREAMTQLGAALSQSLCPASAGMRRAS